MFIVVKKKNSVRPSLRRRRSNSGIVRAIGYSLKIMLAGACCITALFICGCAFGRPFDIEKVSQLKEGVTTKEDVIALFGKPCSDITTGYGEGLTYQYANSSGKSQVLSIFLGKDEKVLTWNTAVIADGYKHRRKPIDMTKVNQIEAGVTTEGEVISLLGKPETVSSDSSGRTGLHYMYIREKKSEITPIDIAAVGLVGAFLQRHTVEMQAQGLIITIGTDKKVVDVSTYGMKLKP